MLILLVGGGIFIMWFMIFMAMPKPKKKEEDE